MNGCQLLIFFYFFFFNFSRNLHQLCIIATFSDIKKMKCGGVHLLVTSPQTVRVTIQSRQSNIEAAQVSFPVLLT